MLVNDYVDLYQSPFYEEGQSEFLSRNNFEGLNRYKRMYDLANQLFLECKKCISYADNVVTEDNMVIDDNNDIIMEILSNDIDVLGMLKDVQDYETISNPSDSMTSLDAAIIVCSRYLEKIKNHNNI